MPWRCCKASTITFCCFEFAYAPKARLEYAAIYRQKNPAGRIVVLEGRERHPFHYDLMLPSPLAPTELSSGMRGLLQEIETCH
jgi:hypothetical protein